MKWLCESSDAHHKAKDYLKQVSRSQLVTNVLSCHTCAGTTRCLMRRDQLVTNVLSCHTCAGNTRCLMSHEQLHNLDCKALLCPVTELIWPALIAETEKQVGTSDRSQFHC
jgi:hypothetical protein